MKILKHKPLKIQMSVIESWSILVRGEPMQCTDGRVYTFKSVTDALGIMNMCYGFSSVVSIGINPSKLNKC